MLLYPAGSLSRPPVETHNLIKPQCFGKRTTSFRSSVSAAMSDSQLPGTRTCAPTTPMTNSQKIESMQEQINQLKKETNELEKEINDLNRGSVHGALAAVDILKAKVETLEDMFQEQIELNQRLVQALENQGIPIPAAQTRTTPTNRSEQDRNRRRLQ